MEDGFRQVILRWRNNLLGESVPDVVTLQLGHLHLAEPEEHYVTVSLEITYAHTWELLPRELQRLMG